VNFAFWVKFALGIIELLLAKLPDDALRHVKGTTSIKLLERSAKSTKV